MSEADRLIEQLRAGRVERAEQLAAEAELRRAGLALHRAVTAASPTLSDLRERPPALYTERVNISESESVRVRRVLLGDPPPPPKPRPWWRRLLSRA